VRPQAVRGEARAAARVEAGAVGLGPRRGERGDGVADELGRAVVERLQHLLEVLREAVEERRDVVRRDLRLRVRRLVLRRRAPRRASMVFVALRRASMVFKLRRRREGAGAGAEQQDFEHWCF